MSPKIAKRVNVRVETAPLNAGKPAGRAIFRGSVALWRGLADISSCSLHAHRKWWGTTGSGKDAGRRVEEPSGDSAAQSRLRGKDAGRRVEERSKLDRRSNDADLIARRDTGRDLTRRSVQLSARWNSSSHMVPGY